MVSTRWCDAQKAQLDVGIPAISLVDFEPDLPRGISIGHRAEAQSQQGGKGGRIERAVLMCRLRFVEPDSRSEIAVEYRI